MNNTYYIAMGFENAEPFENYFTLTDLVRNKGDYKDTEFFYSILEQLEKLVNLKKYENDTFYVNRDDFNDAAIIMRVSEQRYIQNKPKQQ